MDRKIGSEIGSPNFRPGFRIWIGPAGRLAGLAGLLAGLLGCWPARLAGLAGRLAGLLAGWDWPVGHWLVGLASCHIAFCRVLSAALLWLHRTDRQALEGWLCLARALQVIRSRLDLARSPLMGMRRKIMSARYARKCYWPGKGLQVMVASGDKRADLQGFLIQEGGGEQSVWGTCLCGSNL